MTAETDLASRWLGGSVLAASDESFGEEQNLLTPAPAVPDPRRLEVLTIDLASQAYGGAVVACSDDYFTSAGHLNRPDRARTMGEGWETRRRRDGGHGHVVIRLAFPGVIRRIVVDTAHFKYNASADVALAGSAQDAPPPAGSAAWRPLLDRTRLQPDTRHEFASHCDKRVSTVRPDA